LELLDKLKENPTVKDLESEKKIKIRVYNPGQYKTRGVERFARQLFASKFGSKSPNIAFNIEKQEKDKILLKLKEGKNYFYITKEAVLPALRTYSQVRKMNITNEEEVAIIDIKSVPEEFLRLSGLLPIERVTEAAQDIKSAYQMLASNLLLVRRVQLSSPQLYWLAFYSENKVISNAVLLNVQTFDSAITKLLTLYFNSVIALLQLLSFVVETRGTWVDLHGDQVWSHLHVPEFDGLRSEIMAKAQTIFGEVGKVDAKPLFSRLKEHDPFQRSIDELALEMLELDDWKSRLNEIYDAVTKELEAMHKILETSRKPPRKSVIELEREEERETDLTKWFG